MQNLRKMCAFFSNNNNNNKNSVLSLPFGDFVMTVNTHTFFASHQFWTVLFVQNIVNIHLMFSFCDVVVLILILIFWIVLMQFHPTNAQFSKILFYQLVATAITTFMMIWMNVNVYISSSYTLTHTADQNKNWFVSDFTKSMSLFMLFLMIWILLIYLNYVVSIAFFISNW